MSIRRIRLVLALLLVAVCCSTPVLGESFFRSVGLRVIVPWTGAPFLIGLEATKDLGIALGTASFYLNASGQTLITLGANIPLGDEGNPLQVYVRGSTGLAYLDPRAFGPDILLGVGAVYELHSAAPWIAGFAVEMVYPIAFPTPMITIAGGYLFP